MYGLSFSQILSKSLKKELNSPHMQTKNLAVLLENAFDSLQKEFNELCLKAKARITEGMPTYFSSNLTGSKTKNSYDQQDTFELDSWASNFETILTQAEKSFRELEKPFLKKEKYAEDSLFLKLYFEGVFPAGGACKARSIDMIDDRSLIAVGDSAGCLTLYESDSLQRLDSRKLHNSAISTVKYSNSKGYLFTTAAERSIKVCQISEDVEFVKTLEGHTDHPKVILVIDEQSLMLSAGTEPNIKIWDMDTLKLKGEIDTRGRGILGSQMVYLSSQGLVGVGLQNGCIGLYSIEKKNEVSLVLAQDIPTPIDALIYLEEKNLLVAGVGRDGCGGKIKCWNIKRGGRAEEHDEFSFDGDVPRSILAFNKERTLIFASNQNKLFMLDIESGGVEESRDIDLTECVALADDQDRRRIIVGDGSSAYLAVFNY